MKLHFFWNGEQGAVTQVSVEETINNDPVLVLDFLVDIILISQALYTNVLEEQEVRKNGFH